MSDKTLLYLNDPGEIVELTLEEAELLGAFEETALSEAEALDASEIVAPDADFVEGFEHG